MAMLTALLRRFKVLKKETMRNPYVLPPINLLLADIMSSMKLG